MPDAVRRAKQYVTTAIQTNPKLGQGHGPLNHGHVLRGPHRGGCTFRASHLQSFFLARSQGDVEEVCGQQGGI